MTPNLATLRLWVLELFAMYATDRVGQTDRQTDRQTEWDRQTDRQTDGWTKVPVGGIKYDDDDTHLPSFLFVSATVAMLSC